MTPEEMNDIIEMVMTAEEMNDFFEVVKIDEGENEWAKGFDQLAIKLADELADLGPRGKLDFTPAISEAGALIVIDDGRRVRLDVWHNISSARGRTPKG